MRGSLLGLTDKKFYYLSKKDNNIDDILERELEKIVEFLNVHRPDIIKEKSKTDWQSTQGDKYYEVPQVSLVLTCIDCQQSYQLSVIRTKHEGLRFSQFYDIDVPECETEPYNRNNELSKQELKEKLIREIDEILDDDLEEIDDIYSYHAKKSEDNESII